MMQDRSSQPRPISEQTTLPGEPMVSVAITSYKSAETITRAIDSVLLQITNFPVEIVVGEDSSPDATLAVAEALAERYPGVIRVMARPVNLGIQRNYYQTFMDCRGKYIAWLDADDWWTAPDKLQRQVEAMEADTGIVICGHFVRWVTSGGEVARPRYPEMAPGRYRLRDILQRDFLPSPSVVFRRGLEKLLPAWYFEAAPLTDWPLYALAAREGDILLLDGILADYHLTPNSNLWGQGEAFWYRLDVKFYDFIHSSLPPAMQRFVRVQQGLRYERLAYFLRKNGQSSEAVRAAWGALRAAPLFANASKWKSFAAAVAARTGLLNSSKS